MFNKVELRVTEHVYLHIQVSDMEGRIPVSDVVRRIPSNGPTTQNLPNCRHAQWVQRIYRLLVLWNLSEADVELSLISIAKFLEDNKAYLAAQYNRLGYILDYDAPAIIDLVRFESGIFVNIRDRDYQTWVQFW